jgi:Ran GTPase-activating protein 1
MATSAKLFSLEGKGLKLTSAADVEPHIATLRSMTDVEEIRLQGNTLGIEACKVLGEVLETKKTLQVGFSLHYNSSLQRSTPTRPELTPRR